MVKKHTDFIEYTKKKKASNSVGNIPHAYV
jgi:desulfoferrodoxin (superoxide reductase-like protein)